MVALRVWILEFCYLGLEKISVSHESQLALIFELGFVFYWKNIIDYIWFLSWILQIYKNIVDFLVGFWIFSRPWKMVSSIDIIYNFCLQIILKLLFTENVGFDINVESLIWRLEIVSLSFYGGSTFSLWTSCCSNTLNSIFVIYIKYNNFLITN